MVEEVLHVEVGRRNLFRIRNGRIRLKVVLRPFLKGILKEVFHFHNRFLLNPISSSIRRIERP